MRGCARLETNKNFNEEYRLQSAECKIKEKITDSP
jgi:hypothetical protein